MLRDVLSRFGKKARQQERNIALVMAQLQIEPAEESDDEEKE